MTDERCNELLDAWDRCNRELAELADCRTCDDDPVAREGELLETLDEIEYEFGMDQLDGHERECGVAGGLASQKRATTRAVTAFCFRGHRLATLALPCQPDSSTAAVASTPCAPTSPRNLRCVKHGYDRAGNRLWRECPVAAANGKDFDELYTYDGLYQLKTFQRGKRSGSLAPHLGQDAPSAR